MPHSLALQESLWQAAGDKTQPQTEAAQSQAGIEAMKDKYSVAFDLQHISLQTVSR